MPSPQHHRALKRVLIVEDEPRLARQLQRKLQNHCDPCVASSLSDANREIASGGWAGFLIDVGLPDGYGTQLLESIRAAHRTQPVVLMTGGDLSQPSRLALVHRAMLVAKPLPTEWLATFGAWLESAKDGDLTDGPAGAGGLATKLAALGLSERECEVLTALATGSTAEMAAGQLGIATATVRGHCFRVYSRLGVGSLAEVVALANGWSH